VQQHQVRFELTRRLDGVFRPVFDAHFVLLGLLEVELEQRGEAFLVVNQQDAFLSAHVVSFACLKRRVTRTPPSGRLRMTMAPPCSSTIFFDTGRPSPVPSPAGLVVKNGSKIFARFSSGMPLPVSSTSAATTFSPTHRWVLL